MNLLLDTHTFVWAALYSEHLSPLALEMITDTSNEVWVSAVCAYEVEYKRRLDDDLNRMPADLNEAVTRLQYRWMAITADHAIAAGQLALVNRDPFDRLLAAQGLVERMTVVTRDDRIADLGCVVAW
jgi:PIN domain nuclease of toxin-antitoxin system